MARVRSIPSDELPPDLADIYERFAGAYGPFRNQVAVFAHVPAALRHLMSMLMELREAKTLPKRYLEIAIVTVSKLNACHYCVAHHKPFLTVEGLSPEAVDRLLDADNPELDNTDRLVIEYATIAWENPQRIPNALFERLRARFSEAQIVELTLRTTLCGFFNRFNDALQIEEEAEVAEACAGCPCRTEQAPASVTKKRVETKMVRVGFAALAALLLCGTGQGHAAASVCANPTQMDGFKTCADVAKAEQEGAVVLYSPDPEANTAALLDRFHKAFPKINTSFIRLQTGALYQKLMTERRAQTYQVDVLQLTDVGYALDFQKRNGWLHYVSPEMAAYKADYKSQPEGDWTWGNLIIAGLAYNPKLVKPEDAPKTWKDSLDPRWKGSINAKVATSGLQHVTWFEMKQLYGDEYWNKFAELQPRVFDSYVQQFDRMVSGQDMICNTAQYSAYLQFKAKGAPVEFVFPTEGVTVTPGVWGAVADSPHPEAAKLFMDWLLSVPGQTAYDQVAFLSSPRGDVAPPPGGVSTDGMKLLYPKDWQGFLATHAAFAKEWDHVTGVR